MELLLLAIPIAVVAGAVVAFKRFWPSAPEPTSSPTSTLLSGPPRQLTTGQIARGVFWGMWLFWLSQIIIAGVAMVVVFGVMGAMMRNAFSGLGG